MISHIEKGKSGEELAIAYLMEKKFKILCSNCRLSRYEIDIIDEKNNVLKLI